MTNCGDEATIFGNIVQILIDILVAKWHYRGDEKNGIAFCINDFERRANLRIFRDAKRACASRLRRDNLTGLRPMQTLVALLRAAKDLTALGNKGVTAFPRENSKI